MTPAAFLGASMAKLVLLGCYPLCDPVHCGAGCHTERTSWDLHKH